MSFYQSIAPYYDFIFPSSPMQVRFVESVTGKPANKRILEAGCGTGNLALQLAGEGAFVDGIDIDSEMIAYAREKSGDVPQVRFSPYDILKISEKWASSSFDAVVSFGNTIVHLNDLGQVKLFFSEVMTVLKPGGFLMVQIINYDRILDQQIEGLETIENEEIRFERFYDLDEPGGKINFRTCLKIKKTGQEINNVVSLLPVRKNQIDTFLKDSGFTDIQFYSNFAGDGFSEESVPLVFSARKGS